MDLEGYWQENKRFVVHVAGGVIVFLVGLMVVNALYAEDIGRQTTRIRRLQRDLSEVKFDASDRDVALAENQALSQAVDRLSEAVRFVPRPELSLDLAGGSAANQYLRALARVRERVLLRAGRANVSIEPGLGMPTLSPTAEDEIRRYLEALDVVETVTELAIDAGVRRVNDIQVRLDPGLLSHSGLGQVERTRVTFSMVGDSFALTNVLGGTRRPVGGRVLQIETAEVLADRGQERQLRLDLTIVVPRLHPPQEEG